MRLLLLLLVLGTPCVVAQESKSKLRTWTSSVGTKIEAELVSSTGKQVTLKTKAGRTLQVPINKLSKADQEFIAAKSSSKEPTNGEASINHNLKYEIKGDAVTITGCDKKASGALTIPAMIEGKSVTSIGKGAFVSCTNLTSITTPDSVTSIGSSALSRCAGLTSITFGTNSKLTSIGSSAFRSCESLTGITIPDGVTSIGYRTFFECANLSTVTFLGDAPKEGQNIFTRSTPTIYRKPEAKGWGDTFAGRPVKLISEKP